MQALAERETEREVVHSDFLTEWIKEGRLLSLIMDAARTLQWPESELRLTASSGYAFRRLVLLTVVAYCRAAGVSDSKEIARKIAGDEILRFLCAGTFPTWEDIRHFTHQNEDVIEQTLIRTCQLARNPRLGKGVAGSTNGRWEKLEGMKDRTRLDVGFQFATTAAE